MNTNTRIAFVGCAFSSGIEGSDISPLIAGGVGCVFQTRIGSRRRVGYVFSNKNWEGGFNFYLKILIGGGSVFENHRPPWDVVNDRSHT